MGRCRKIALSVACLAMPLTPALAQSNQLRSGSGGNYQRPQPVASSQPASRAMTGAAANNRTVGNRTASNQSSAGAVSADLLRVYEQTKQEQTEKSVTAIARVCSQVIPDRRRSRVDRDYAASLLAWALNRRGELRSQQAGELVEQGDTAAAAKIDAAATEDFKTALKYSPNNWRTHHNLAIALAMRGDYEGSIAEFDAAIEQKPDYANAYFNRAELFFELEQYEAAVEDYSQAISLKKTDAQYYNSRAHAQFMQEEYVAALSDYQRAAELATDEPVFRTDLADAYQFLGRWADAAGAYRAAVAIDNSYARAYQNAAWLMATCPVAKIRNTELALSAAKRARDLSNQPDSRVLDTLAAATAASGKLSEAVKIQQQALKLAIDETEQQEMQQRLALYKSGKAYRQPKSLTAATESVGQEAIRTASGTQPATKR